MRAQAPIFVKRGHRRLVMAALGAKRAGATPAASVAPDAIAPLLAFLSSALPEAAAPELSAYATALFHDGYSSVKAMWGIEDSELVSAE